jgi:hypothetical protein
MRSKYSVSHSARVENGQKTINLFGVEFEKNTSVPAAFYHAKVTDDSFAAFWSRISNEPVPADASGDVVGGIKAVRFSHTAEPYVSLSIPAEKALDLIANGDAVEGVKLQPEIAG